MDMASQLGPNARGNGDLAATFSLMAARGWTSKASLEQAIAELIENNFILVTRQGGRHKCSLYAICNYALDCDLSKLDVRPGSFSKSDWTQGRRNLQEPPTKSSPAVWHPSQSRRRAGQPPLPPETRSLDSTDRSPENDFAAPSGGAIAEELPPTAGQKREALAPVAPACGSVSPFSGDPLPPPAGTYVDSPSTPATGHSPPAVANSPAGHLSARKPSIVDTGTLMQRSANDPAWISQ